MESPQLSQDLIDFIKNNSDKSLTEMKAVSTEKLQNTTQKNTMQTSHLSYDTNSPIPGQKMIIENTPANISNNTLKKEAGKTLIATAANHKLKKEIAAEKRRPIEERVKEFYINQIINHQKNDFFVNNGYNMSGKKLRNLKRIVTMKYNMGKIKPTAKEYDDIITYLNSPLNDPDNKKVNPMKSDKSTGQQIGNLLSKI